MKEDDSWSVSRFLSFSGGGALGLCCFAYRLDTLEFARTQTPIILGQFMLAKVVLVSLLSWRAKTCLMLLFETRRPHDSSWKDLHEPTASKEEAHGSIIKHRRGRVKDCDRWYSSDYCHRFLGRWYWKLAFYWPEVEQVFDGGCKFPRGQW